MSGGTTALSILNSDTLNGVSISDPSDVVLTPGAATGGLTLNAANQIVVPAGTAAGSYTLAYQICDAANPSVCDSVTETVTVEGGAIALVKEGNLVEGTLPADGNAEVGDTIVYSFTVTNPGDYDLTGVTLSEDSFSGNGATPLTITGPVGDTGSDGVLGTAESWVYSATYVIVADDITDGGVTNQASVSATTPGGGTVTDLSLIHI